MAGASRRGYGEDGIYFDHRGDCRDSALHKTCTGRWRGVVSLGFGADGKRLRRKVSGQTKAEVKDKLKALHSELDAGLRTAQGYTVEKAVADWLEKGLPGRTVKTVEANRDSLRPLLAVIGRIPLKDLTVSKVRTALRAGGGDRPAGRACQLADDRGDLPAGAAAGDHDRGRGHGPDLPAEAATDKYHDYCRMKNLGKRAERNKRVKLAPVRLSPKEAG